MGLESLEHFCYKVLVKGEKIGFNLKKIRSPTSSNQFPPQNCFKFNQQTHFHFPARTRATDLCLFSCFKAQLSPPSTLYLLVFMFVFISYLSFLRFSYIWLVVLFPAYHDQSHKREGPTPVIAVIMYCCRYISQLPQSTFILLLIFMMNMMKQMWGKAMLFLICFISDTNP